MTYTRTAYSVRQVGGTDKFVLLSRIARAGKLVGIVDLAENQVGTQHRAAPGSTRQHQGMPPRWRSCTL